jgi:ubiquinone/menaquinone biosynthesis C-methylase UbiE
MRPKATTRSIYNAVADRYESTIVAKAFAKFAAAVIPTANPQGHEHTLDIGTGTGILARLLAPRVRQVIGIDLAPQMIAAGKRLSLPENVALQEADAEKLPFEKHTFDLAVSSFGLNATTPHRVLPEIHRVLKPEGVFAFHEWDDLHPLDDLIMDVLAQYMLDDDEVSDELFHLREYLTAPRPWDNVFQSAEDYQEELANYGFQAIQVWEDAAVELVISIPDFLDYKLAWTPRQLELNAMDEWRRADCLDTLRSKLQDQADENGDLHYAPVLFRVRAQA